MSHARDIVVIGCSAGGLEPLFELVSGLPGSLPAALFVVMHTAPSHASMLPELLRSRSGLRASHATHHEPITPGRLYIAPGDNHLLVRRGFVEVVRGPRENGHRPAVDPLFRSAARSYGARVIAVVLSGNDTCGTLGMMAVKAAGGLCVVQSPESAIVPEMPQSALARVSVDRVSPPEELNEVLRELTGDGSRASLLAGEDHEAEGRCPRCGAVRGDLDGSPLSAPPPLAMDDRLEAALWAAVRALEDGAEKGERMAATTSPFELRARLEERVAAQRRQSELIRSHLLAQVIRRASGQERDG